MFALVESGKITQFPKGNKGITIGDNQYPSSIYTLWTEAERNAIGIYTVAIDNTNKKDEAFYINTDVTYTFTGSAVTGSYGTATAKKLADEDAVDESGNKIKDADGNQVINYGLKTKKKRIVKQQASGLLAPTDWHVVKATEVAEYNVPENITSFRTEVRAKSNEMETQIDACTTVDELKALYEYTRQEDGTQTRPLAEFPKEVV